MSACSMEARVIKLALCAVLCATLFDLVVGAPTAASHVTHDTVAHGPSHHGRNYDWGDYFSWGWGNDRCHKNQNNRGGKRRTTTATTVVTTVAAVTTTLAPPTNPTPPPTTTTTTTAATPTTSNALGTPTTSNAVGR